MQSFIDFLLNRRYFLAAACILLGAALTWGMTRSSLDGTFGSILSEDDPYKAEVDEAREDFPPSTSVLFAFQTDTDVFTLEALGAINALTQRYTEVESAISVGSLMNRRLNAEDADRLDRDYLLPEFDELESANLAKIKQVAINDSDLTKSILSPEGDMALATIKYKAPRDDQETRLSIARSVVALRDSLREQYPDVGIYILGSVLFELDSYNAQIKDNKYLSPLVMLTCIGLLWFCLRSLSFSLCLFAVAFSTIGMTVGTWGWTGIAFNQISSLAPLVVLVIAVADGIHIVSVYSQGLTAGKDKMDAMPRKPGYQYPASNPCHHHHCNGFPQPQLLFITGHLRVWQYRGHWCVLGLPCDPCVAAHAHLVATREQSGQTTRSSRIYFGRERSGGQARRPLAFHWRRYHCDNPCHAAAQQGRLRSLQLYRSRV